MRKLKYPRGLIDIKSIHSAGVRSIPKILRSPYLDLYVLAREKERIEKEDYALGKKSAVAERRLKLINKRMENLREEIQEQPQTSQSYRSSSKKPLKRMSINY